MLFTNATLLPELLEQLEAYMGFSGENWPIKLKKKTCTSERDFGYLCVVKRGEEIEGMDGSRAGQTASGLVQEAHWGSRWPCNLRARPTKP